MAHWQPLPVCSSGFSLPSSPANSRASDQNVADSRIDSRIENLKTQRENIEEGLDEVKGPESILSLRRRKQRTIPPTPDRYKNPIPPAHVSPPSEDEQEELDEWHKYNQQVASNFNLQLENVETEIESLRQEHTRLEDRYKSLDFSDIESTLNASFIAIVLAVLIPSIVYFLRANDLTFIPAPVAAEAGLVLITWAAGLFYVLYHIRDQIQNEDETKELPDKPDLDTKDDRNE